MTMIAPRRNTVVNLRHRLNMAGGFTVRMEGTTPTDYVESGYALSLYPDREFTFSADAKGDTVLGLLIQYASDNRDLLSVPNNYMGAWLDTESGKVFLDVSTVVEDKAKALELAGEFGQLAVYHLDSGEEIRL